MTYLKAALALALLGLATAAAADGVTVAGVSSTPRAPAVTTTPTTTGGDISGFGAAISIGVLATYSGGTQIHNNQNLNGTVSGNSASQVVTGNNTISADSFSNAAGIPTVIQNSGNNVLIQNGIIVNLQMKP